MNIPEVMKPQRFKGSLEQIEGKSEFYIVEPKWDGYRTLIVKHEDGRVQAVSRLGNDKTFNIPHLIVWADAILPQGTIIDGEIIFPTDDPYVSDFTKVKMIMGSQPAEAQRKQRFLGKVAYRPFDILSYKNSDVRDAILEERLHFLSTAVEEFNPPTPLSLQAIDDIMSHSLVEGVVFKNLKGKYCSGKRPVNNWYKIKVTDSIDAVVMGFRPPDEFNAKGEETWIHKAGLIGAVEFGQYKGGVLIYRGRTSGMNVQVRADMTHNPQKYLGQVIEVQHMGLLPDRVRHPQFKGVREDKLPEECTWDY